MSNQRDPIAELLIPKTPEIHVSGDTMLLDIDDVVPGWGTYTFILNTIQPGQQRIVLRIKHRAVETNVQEVQTESPTISETSPTLKEESGIVVKLEMHDPIKMEDKEVDLNVGGNYVRCPTIPCHLLICRNIPGYIQRPSKYLTRGFDPYFLPLKIAEERLSAEEYGERLRKRRRLM